jgi:hypothetical protein
MTVLKILLVIAGVLLVALAVLAGTTVRGRRVPRLGNVTRGLVALLGVFVVFIGLGTFVTYPDDDEGRPPSTAPTSPGPTPAPPENETDRLLTHLPPNLGQYCRPPQAPPPGALAEVECTLGQTVPEFVSYTSYADAGAMNSAYDAILGGNEPPAGSCATPQDFVTGGQHRYEEPNTGQAGRLRCYTTTDGVLVMDWTDETLNILATAAERDQQDAQRFLDWVLNNAGPFVTATPEATPTGTNAAPAR